MKQVVVLAGGKGTRLSSRTGDLPKPMVEVDGVPLLRRQLELARSCGFTDALLCLGYRGDVIRDYFGDGSIVGLRVEYSDEPTPMGTAGAVRLALARLAERFVVLYGDTMLDVDLDRVVSTHIASGADGTLFLHPNDHPYDSDLVSLDERGFVSAFHAPPHREDRYLPNLVNAALYVLERRVVEAIEPGVACDFARDVFPALVRGERSRLYGYQSPEYIKDMGTPDRLDKVEKHLRSGRVDARSMRRPQPAVFLDRDGVLNPCDDYIRAASEFELFDGVAAAVRALNEIAPRTVVVTNQPVVARGECTEQELARIHAKLETLLGRERAFVDRIYYCPHHPDSGFPGERVDLKIRCECRKPGIGMLQRAADELAIDLGASWFVGDSTVDIRAAAHAGSRSVLVRTGHGGRDGKFDDRPDYVVDSLRDAVSLIEDVHPRLVASAERAVGGVTAGGIVAIGGLARAGKSTFASVVREVLVRRGLDVALVELDEFIQPVDVRPGPGLRDSYDMDAIAGFLDTLVAARSEPIVRRRRIYDRTLRATRESRDLTTIKPSTVIIVEGVPALVATRGRAGIRRVHVECDEPTRHARFVADYRSRGFEDDSIDALYLARSQHENAAVMAERESADVRLSPEAP